MLRSAPVVRRRTARTMKPNRSARSSVLVAVFASSVVGAWSLGRQEEAAAPTVLRRFVEHEARPAQLEFEVATRTLTVVGEARRPFAFDGATDPKRPVWWTTIGPLDAAPELRYLILEEGRRALDDTNREPTGLPERYLSELFAVVPITFGKEVAGYVNTNAGDLDVKDPSHFRRLTSLTGQTAFLLVGLSGNLDVVIPHDTIEGKFFSGEAEGDGTDQRLGGLQIDLVFEAVLGRLPGSSLRLLGDVNEESLPIERYERERF
jgi:hypothetical protein